VGLKVVRPGLFDTIQDEGRPGYREWGVLPGGAFDRGAYRLANALLGNPPVASALEMTLAGGEYEADAPTAIALAGAPMSATILFGDGRQGRLAIPQTATLYASDRLIVGATTIGARTYLAVGGGLSGRPSTLGSRSSEEPLRSEVRLLAGPVTTPVRRPAEPTFADPSAGPIRLIDGPDAALLPDREIWRSLTFRVGAQSNRMGLRLESGPLPVRPDPERLSTPVAPGAVQVAGDQAIILGVACGTMGGYPHVAHVISADHDRLAQARPGQELRLERVSLDEARALDREARRVWRARLTRIAALAADRWGH
jgi:antagonist of KipI